MEYDMNLRVREMVVQRLDDAVEQMQRSSTTEKYPQLIRLLVESLLWLIRDWPGQKIDDFESVRASRKEVEGRLRQFLRVRPPRTCEMESNILLVSDAILAISEQWPVDKADKPSPAPAPEPISAPQQRVVVQKRPHQPDAQSFASTPVNAQSHANGRPVYGTPGTSSQQAAAKITRIVATPQQLSNSAVNSFAQPTPYRSWEQPHRMPQSGNAGTPSRLWSFFTKVMGESGENLARCNVCQRVVPRQNHGTSGMKNHLKAHHPQEFAALDSDTSIRTEAAHSSPHFVSMEKRQPRKRTASSEKTPPSVSAIVAALHSGPTTICLSDDGSYSPLFNEATVKEEEVDFAEEMERYKAATKVNDEPNEAERAMLNEQLASLQKPRAVTSDIWTYFTKEDAPNGEKFGSCKLCDWSKKIHNHGTNGMWGHLKKHHPPEYSILKPYEYNPAVHGQFIPSSMPGCAVVPGGSVVIVPGGILPANLVMPRPMEAGEDAVKDEEDKS